MAKPQYLQCVECGHQQPYQPLVPTDCEICKSSWVEAYYNYNDFKRKVLVGLPGRSFNIWRYSDVLPVEDPTSLDLDNIGGTPLRISRRYASLLNHDQILIKDERYGPTNSFKDRQAAVSV